MTRTYKPNLKGKQRVPHSEKEIQDALTAVSKGSSLRSAAKKYGIPKSVLHRRKKSLESGIKPRKIGGQTILSEEVEKHLVDRLITCADWGYPCDAYDLRCIIKSYLDFNGYKVPKFKNNFPGKDFAYSFLNRHKAEVTERMCQNIKRARAGVNHETIHAYFSRIQETLKDIPASNIINYDETNLSDDPGRKKVITKRGTKYPERVMNQTKSSTSLMYAATGDGKLLPVYVVYKALHIYDSWRVGGPKNARYNRSACGWFDSCCFLDWLKTVIVPFVSKLPGRTVLLGDNLSSHLSAEAVRLCEQHNIELVFLPGNSTHLTQPLDVAFFGPMKTAWRQILEKWKKGPGRKQSTIPKETFPQLLRKLHNEIQENAEKNILAGFRKCGVIPLNPQKVLEKLPKCVEKEVENNLAIDDSFVNLLKEMRFDGPKPRVPRKRLNVEPGKSVQGSDFLSTPATKPVKTIAKNTQKQLQSSPVCSSDSEESIPEVEDINEDKYVRKNGEPVTGVYHLSDAVKENDWIVVDFNDREASSSKKARQSWFIGMVMHITAEEDLDTSFVKFVYTKIDPGSTFKWPDKEDRCVIKKDWIVGGVLRPKLLRRGLMKFELNINQW